MMAEGGSGQNQGFGSDGAGAGSKWGPWTLKRADEMVPIEKV